MKIISEKVLTKENMKIDKDIRLKFSQLSNGRVLVIVGCEIVPKKNNWEIERYACVNEEELWQVIREKLLIKEGEE